MSAIPILVSPDTGGGFISGGSGFSPIFSPAPRPIAPPSAIGTFVGGTDDTLGAPSLPSPSSGVGSMITPALQAAPGAIRGIGGIISELRQGGAGGSSSDDVPAIAQNLNASGSASVTQTMGPADFDAEHSRQDQL